MSIKGYLWIILGIVIVLLSAPANAKRQRNRQRSVLAECQVDLNNVTFTRLLDCVRDKSLLYLDRITATNSIDLLGGGAVKLVRRKGESTAVEESNFDLFHKNPESNLKDSTNPTWALSVVNKVTNLLKTHVLQIDVIKPNYTGESVQRSRRRRQMMVPAMLFGLIAIGMIIVPMGFQLLSMFAGKAVLLSKLALLLASLNGLKRVANAGIGYGFYAAPDVHPQIHHQHPHMRPPMWDRSEQPRDGYFIR